MSCVRIIGVEMKDGRWLDMFGDERRKYGASVVPVG